MKYRSEIDGLRALAVVPVIFYHAGAKLFPGGFVGVDIFFVISGYLITTIILDDIKSGSFSISNFYERRARRILPVLFLVMLTSFMSAWFWLTPPDARSFSASLVAVSTFASNLLFWRTSGYFDSASELKPLIHTWSLAVEEQYYIFFPLFLILTRGWTMWRTICVLTTIALISLVAAQWGASRFPSAAFYLLPTRAWELLIGVFIAYYFQNVSLNKDINRTSEIASLLGFLMIAYSIFTFNDQTPFPGFYALIPTLGAALIITFITNSTIVGKCLSSKWVVLVGLTSYSAYLWHQPLLAFARQQALDDLGYVQIFSIVIGSFVLAYVSWKFVEQPFRNRSFLNRQQIFAFGIAGTMSFMAIGIYGYSTKGLLARYDHEQRDFFLFFENSIPAWTYFTRQNILSEYRSQCDFYDLDSYRSGHGTRIPRASISDECYSRVDSHAKSIFIWGDSHAQQLYPGLKRSLPIDWQILQVTSSGCKPSLAGEDSETDYCKKSNWFAINKIIASSPDVVIVGQNSDHDSIQMELVGKKLKEIGVKMVIFTGPTPHWKIDLPIIVATRLWNNTPVFSNVGLDKNVIEINKSLKHGNCSPPDWRERGDRKMGACDRLTHRV